MEVEVFVEESFEMGVGAWKENIIYSSNSIALNVFFAELWKRKLHFYVKSWEDFVGNWTFCMKVEKIDLIFLGWFENNSANNI